MEAKNVVHQPAWDRERLGCLANVLQAEGSKLSLPVIREISALVSTSIPVSKVVIHLYQRRVVSNDDYEDLKKEQPSAGIKLSHALVASSKRSVGEGKNLIKNLYLALLDAFLDTYDQGCHHVALHLRETAIDYLQRNHVLKELSEESRTDMQSSIERLPDVNLQSPAAFKLRDQLDLPHGTEVTSLKAILEKYNKSKVNVGPNPDTWLVAVVQAMMLTQGVGRYVTYLLPFHKSYPAELLIFLDRLGEKWEFFALFLGFTNGEVRDIRRRSFGKTQQEIKNFSKVWRMPDVEQETEEILHRVLNAANIIIGVPVEESSPAVYSSCLHQIPNQGSQMEHVIKVINDGITITTQVSHQSSADSPRPISQRSSLRSNASERHQRELRSMQSGSSDLGGSFESDVPHHTISRQSHTINDVDTDTMSNAPYVRESSFFQEEDDSAIASSYPSPTKPALTSQHPLAPKPFPGTLGLDSTTSRPTSLEVCPISQPTTAHSGEMVAPLLTSPQKQPLASDQPTIDSALPQFHPDDEVTIKPNGIGRGLYGEVWRVEHKNNPYAAKEYRSGFITPEELKEKFGQKMLSLKHENVVRYLGVCRIKETNRSVVIMEMLPTNLKSICGEQAREKIELLPETKFLILRQITEGLAYLHLNGIIHCDLIPTNILMLTKPEYTAKIADCGNALVGPISTVGMDGHLDGASVCDYLPPEALEGDISNAQVDVFSFAHLSLYVILQHEPHPLKTPTYKLEGKLTPRTEVERRLNYFIEMRTVNCGKIPLEPLVQWIELCLSDEASDRPEITQFKKQVLGE